MQLVLQRKTAGITLSRGGLQSLLVPVRREALGRVTTSGLQQVQQQPLRIKQNSTDRSKTFFLAREIQSRLADVGLTDEADARLRSQQQPECDEVRPEEGWHIQHEDRVPDPELSGD